MLTVVFIVVQMIQISSAHVHFEEKSYAFSEDLSKVVDIYFRQESSLGVIFESRNSFNFAPVLLSRFKLPTILLDFSQPNLLSEETGLDVDGFILITRNLTNITWPKRVFSALKNVLYKLKTRKILVIDIISELNPTGGFTQLYMDFFKSVWADFQLVNLVLSPIVVNETTSVPILTYNPFSGSISQKLKIHKYNTSENFPDEMQKRFKNLGQYQLKTGEVYTEESREVDKKNPLISQMFYEHRLKEVLEGAFNVSIEVEMYTKENFPKNTTLDFVMKIERMQPQVLDRFQFGDACFDEKVVVIVKRKVLYTIGEILCFIFEIPVWVCLIALLSLATCIYIITEKSDMGNQNIYSAENKRHHAVMKSSKSSVDIIFSHNTRTKSGHVFIIIYRFSYLILMTVILGQIFTFIKTKPSDSSVKTVQDLLKSNMTIYTYYFEHRQYFMELYGGGDSMERRLRFKKMHPVHMILSLVHPAPDHKEEDFAVMTSIKFLKLSEIAHSSHRHDFQVLDDDMAVVFRSTLTMDRESIFFKHFNTFATKLYQSGVLLHWQQQEMKQLVEFEWKTELAKKKMPRSFESIQKLYLADLRIPISVLCIGLIISAVVFVLEYIQII